MSAAPCSAFSQTSLKLLDGLNLYQLFYASLALPGCSFETWVGCNCAGEVVGLCSQQDVPVPPGGLQRRRLSRPLRQQHLDFPTPATDSSVALLDSSKEALKICCALLIEVYSTNGSPLAGIPGWLYRSICKSRQACDGRLVEPPDGRGVVLEADDRVPGVGCQGVFDQAHEALWLGLSINHQMGPKEPVATAKRAADGQSSLAFIYIENRGINRNWDEAYTRAQAQLGFLASSP